MKNKRSLNIIKGILHPLDTLIHEAHWPTLVHQGHVASLLKAYGIKAKLSHDYIEILILAGLFHDLGKLPIATSLRRIENEKVDKDHPDMMTIRNHTILADVYLRGLEKEFHLHSSEIIFIAQAARSHHERWDGAGYPDGLSGIDIPKQAREVAVADAIDAMSNLGRIWKKPFSIEETCEELNKHSGSQFDPEIVDIFISLLTTVE